MWERTRRDTDVEADAAPRAPEERPAPPAAQVLDLQRSAGNQAVSRALHRMSIVNVKTPSIVSSETRKKHVVAEADQEAEATAGFGPRTFVTSEKTLTDAVDADSHNFTEGPGQASDRKDIQASVVITLYRKKNPSGPGGGGFAKGQPVEKEIDNKAELCEIGVKKTGDGRISIMHFQKL